MYRIRFVENGFGILLMMNLIKLTEILTQVTANSPNN